LIEAAPERESAPLATGRLVSGRRDERFYV
jgi:hypothetical protein